MWAYFRWGSDSKSPRRHALSNIDLQLFGRLNEMIYPPWWTQKGFISWYRDLPDDTLWNSYICAAVLIAIVEVVVNLNAYWYVEIFDAVYNISYAAHVVAIGYRMLSEKENIDTSIWILGGFLLDLGTFSHYVSRRPYYKLGCYYLRLHRPFKYLYYLYDYNLRSSILGTTLKYCYIFMVLRITWAWIWLRVNLLEKQFNFIPSLLAKRLMNVALTDMSSNDSDATKFLSSLYIVNKMFIPIGLPVVPDNDVERVTSLFVILSGCLVVTGAAVATLSLVISLYMSPEETFRSRYRLIIKELKDSQVPPSLREKVQIFYHMYWHKHRAVSETQLLPTFPPTLPATVYTDIYFEATQKSRILRELSYQFLSELAKKMETIHYIPGDAIIERSAKRSAIIYITYGDIEMLTAEDDMTAILRFTRGTVLTPCGGAAAAAVARAHLAVRAATFCTAHVLHAADLWRLVNKHSVSQYNAVPILTAFSDHIKKVKRHYSMKIPVASLHKSSILHFNRNLMALKEQKDANGKPLLARTDVFLEIAGCYIMRNRLDSTLTDESDAICLRPTFPCILQPYSSLLMAWHSAIAVLILIICVTHPYYLVFLKNVPMEFRFFDYMATALYTVDHFVHLSTGAHIEEGVPITFTQTSSQQMRSKWFVLDVMGTLPIFEFIGDGHFAGINKILRLPKVFRLLKKMEDSWVYHSNVLRFCSYTLLLLIACYLVAAIQQAFMCFRSGYCLVTNFTHSPFWEEKPLDEETVMARLVFGLYWSISMISFTTHMETWGKENMSNVMYTMIIMEFCIVLKTFMEAVYSATITVTTAMREDYDARIATVKRFLIRNEVDPELRSRFITYLQLCWYTDKAYKMTHSRKTSSIFYDLPQHVYQDIIGRNRIKYVLCIPFMKMLKKEELKQLAANANLYYTSPNEILMNTGDLVNEMYVVVRGICEFICPITRKKLGEFTAKNHFGAVVCLFRIPAYFTVRALTHVQIFCISIRHLKPLFENPQIKEAIEYVKTKPEYMRLQKGPPSFLKYEPLPPIPNMERFPLPRKHEHDFAYLHPFHKLGFLSILRYIFPRFTIRPDGKYLLRYEWFRVSCALVSALVFPNYTYLVLQWPWLYYLTWLLDLSAMFDIFQRMLVAYYNEEGILVYHPSSTAAYYIKGPFIVDLIGCLALETLESERIETYENGYRVTPIDQFLMLNRLLQLYRFPSIMQTLHCYIERQDIHLIIYTIPLFICIFNILTCLMVYNSVKIFYFVNAEGQTRWLLEPFDDQGGSWIILFRNTFRFNLTSSPWNLYLATHFWVVYETTTTGYAKFKPSNYHLMEILFIGMAISAMLVTYFSVRIISIRSHVNKPLAGFQQHMRDITMFMKRENLDPTLQGELRCYYEYNWQKMGGIDYRGMLKLCNQITLRTDAILHIYGPTFAKCPLLAQCDISLLRMIGRSVRSIYFVREMKIVECDDVVKDIYFVDCGGVESRVAIGDINQVVRLPRGSLFGNLEGTPTERVPMNIVATSRLHLLMINSQAFYHIINEFPAIKKLMAQYRKTANKHYIVGNMEEFEVKFTRHPETVPFRTRRMDIVKYIYFQKGMIQLYLIIVSLICIYMDLYNAGYQDNRAWLILTLYILDMCFFMKILMQFSLPLLVTNKNLKTLLLPIRRMYFKREFKYDMISCIPIELVSLHMSKNRWFCFSWLRLNRMFRIVTVYNCLKRHNERVRVNFMLDTILTVAVWFSVVVHATTCLWYFIGRLEEQAQPKSSWLYNDDGSSWCGNEYICSLYFIITTFTQNGVGDIMPKKQSEVVFVTVLMILSTMVFMIYVGEFSNIIQNQAFRSFSFYSKYLELQEFLKNNRVSSNLGVIVNKYTLHLWRESRGMQVPRFLTRAPQSLRLRVMSAAYIHHMARHHIFQNCEPAFLRQLVGCLRLYRYNEGMFVVKEKEITNCMYVIHRGKVKETSDDTENMILARVYPAGSYFGALQGLVRGTPFTYSYRTMIKSQVLTLHLDDWEYLLAHFPKSKATIHKNMGNLDDKNMDDSKWPGGLDPDYPPGTEWPKTESETNISNLPKFYENKNVTDVEPSGRTHREVSMASSVSWLSRGTSKNDLESGVPSTRAKEESPTPSLGICPSLDKIALDTEQDKEEKEAPKMGILERIASTAMKLMGRYSDTELNFSIAEVEKDLILEEGATGSLLKQLDEAMRLTREKNRKIKYRSKDIDTDEEDNNEKYMFTFNMDAEEDTDETADVKAHLSRTLRIRDEDSEFNLQWHQSTSAVKSSIIHTADVHDAPTFATSTSVAEEESAKTLDQNKKEMPSILKHLKTTQDVESSSDEASTSKKILDTTALYASDAPRWVVRINSDTNIVELPDRQAKAEKEVEADIETTKVDVDIPPLLPKESSAINYVPSVSDGGTPDGQPIADIESASYTPVEADEQPDDVTADNVVTAIKPHDTQSIPDSVAIADSQPDVEMQPLSDSLAAVDSQPDADTQPLPDSVATTDSQPDADTQPFPDSVATADSQPDADTQPLPNSVATADSQPDADTQPLPDSIATTDSQPDADTQPLPDSVATADSQPDADTQPLPDSVATADSQPDVDTEPIPEVPAVAASRTDVDSQPIPDTPALTYSQLDVVTQSIPNTLATPETQPGADTQPLLDSLATADSQPDADTIPIPDNLVTEDSQPDADTQPLSDSLATRESQPDAVTQPILHTLATKDSQTDGDAQTTLEIPVLTDSQPDADTVSISESITIAGTHPDADTQPIPESIVTALSQPDVDTQPTPATSVTVDSRPDADTQLTLATTTLVAHQPDADTVSIPGSLATAQVRPDANIHPTHDNITTADSQTDPDTKAMPDAPGIADSQLTADTMSTAGILGTTETQPDADTLPIPEELITAEKQLDADTQPIPDNVITARTQPGADTLPVPEIQSSTQKDEGKIEATGQSESTLKKKRKAVTLKYEDDATPSTSDGQQKKEENTTKRKHSESSDSPEPDSDGGSSNKKTKPPSKKNRRSRKNS